MIAEVFKQLKTAQEQNIIAHVELLESSEKSAYKTNIVVYFNWQDRARSQRQRDKLRDYVERAAPPTHRVITECLYPLALLIQTTEEMYDSKRYSTA